VKFSGYTRRLLLLLLLLPASAARITKGIRSSFCDASQYAVQHRPPDQHKSNQEKQFYEGPEHLDL
jgi:hypothetical protein